MRKGPSAQRAEATQYARAFLACEIAEAMSRVEVNQRRLAARLDVTEGRVSQLLHADANPTITTIATLAAALGCNVQVRLVPNPENKP